ncbi:unnamed protein product [Urochloa humidicola]
MAWTGTLSRSVKEIRFLFCQSSPASAAAREFVKNYYGEIKARNPTVPFLIRECSGVQPQLWARYGHAQCTSNLKLHLPATFCRRNGCGEMCELGRSDGSTN